MAQLPLTDGTELGSEDASTPILDGGTFQLADLTNLDLTNADSFSTPQLDLTGTGTGDLTAFAPDTNDYSQFDGAALSGTDPSQLAFADDGSSSSTIPLVDDSAALGGIDLNQLAFADGGTIPLDDGTFLSTPSNPDSIIAFAGSDLETANFDSFLPADGGSSEDYVASNVNIDGADYGDFYS